MSEEYKLNSWINGRITSVLRRFCCDKYFKTVLTDLHNNKVLNIGCGERDYKQFLNETNEVVNFDLRRLPNVNVVGSVTNMPFKDNSFDFIICLNVLEHVKEVGEAVKEIRRVLKNGGGALIHTPFLYPLHDEPYDFRRWTVYGLKELFNNFKIINVRRSNIIHPLFTVGISLLIMKKEGC